MNQLSFV